MGIISRETRHTSYTPASQQTAPSPALDGVLPLAARLLVSVEFVNATLGKIFDWSGQAAYMASHGLPMIRPLLTAALVIEGVGSVCLITGYRARSAAAVMFVYLGIVSLTLHNFWTMTGGAAGANETEFFKNLGIMGGLLMIACYGPGRWSLGARRRASPEGFRRKGRD
jgi:putative oxidoreductase